MKETEEQTEAENIMTEIVKQADVLSRIGIEVRVIRYLGCDEQQKFLILDRKFRDAINLLQAMKDRAYEGSILG